MSHILERDQYKGSLKTSVCRILDAGLLGIDIEEVMKKKIEVSGSSFSIVGDDHIYDTEAFKKVSVIGVGKGARAVTSLFCSRVDGVDYAIALDVEGYGPDVSTHHKVEVYTGTHPHPSDINVKATRSIISFLNGCKKDDLVIFFILGGGSSLLCGDELEKEQGKEIFSLLTDKGASIRELNIVRKHLSIVKGGGLASCAYPSSVLSLVVSDVCGNDLSTVASGPSVFDSSRKEDAIAILEKYNLEEKRQYIRETVKNHTFFERSRALLFVCNEDALIPMLEEARKIGYSARIVSTALQGEAKDIFTPFLSSIHSGEVYIAGGESFVSGCLEGVGGRNQEAVLGALKHLSEIQRKDGSEVCVASIASDGKDNIPVAGAIGCSEDSPIDESFLISHNSYPFFKERGGHIHIKKTCFNISDIMVIVSG